MSQKGQVPATQWETWVAENDGVLLDVREPKEWALGTLPGAMTLAMSQLINRIDEIPKDKPLLVVCRSGDRSNQVARYLSANGYDATNMAGGMKALGLQR
jgi:rhodanese-related sulfurtransferase